MAGPGTVIKSVLSIALSAGSAAILAATTALQGDGRIDGLELLGLLGVLLTGFAVWKLKNLSTGWRYWTKAIVTVVGGIITTLTTSLAGHTGESLLGLFAAMTALQWLLSVALPLVNGLLVALAPNAEVSDDPPQPGGDPNPANI